MAEVVKPGMLERPKRRPLKWTDIVFAVVIAAVIGVLAHTLLNTLSLKHEASAARLVTDRVVSDIQKQDASDARALGDSSFQKEHSAEQLSGLFKTASTYATGHGTVIKQTVSGYRDGDVVAVTYRFNDNKPFYVRIQATKTDTSKKWQLTGLSGNSSEATLTK